MVNLFPSGSGETIEYKNGHWLQTDFPKADSHTSQIGQERKLSVITSTVRSSANSVIPIGCDIGANDRSLVPR